MENMNISLPTALLNIVNDRINSGFYKDVNDVICDAIRQLDKNQELTYQLKLFNLRNELCEGIKDIENGDVIDFDMQKIIQELDKNA